MSRLLLCVQVVAIALTFAQTELSHGREVPDWEYTRLVAESDLVVIAQMESSEPVNFDFSDVMPWSEVLRHPRFGPMLRQILVAEITTFRVNATLKGGAVGKTVRVFHYSFTKEPDFLDNGPCFFKEGLWQSTTPRPSEADVPRPNDRHYLLFLKRREDGTTEAVTGQHDAAFSVREVRNLLR